MTQNRMKWTLITLALAIVLTAGACKKHQVPPAPPAAPPPPAPKATLSVSPESIQRGGSATLTWSTQDATGVSIDGIGTVQPNGSQPVSPRVSTTYHLTAQGPGGAADASTRVTVVEPPPPPAPAPEQSSVPPDVGAAQLVEKNVRDIYFEYDRYDLRPEDKAVVDSDAAFLKSHPSIKLTVEGHCDERGSTDYNLALGDNRANAAREALLRAGVSADQIKVISYGKEKPFCTESTEECWQSNRRDHFVYGQN
jgi:peptidoglycan-associated lipoprotein